MTKKCHICGDDPEKRLFCSATHPDEVVKFIMEGGRIWDFPNPTAKAKIWENYYMSVWPEPVETLCPVCGMDFTDERKFERHLERCYRAQQKVREHVRRENEKLVVMWNSWNKKDD